MATGNYRHSRVFASLKNITEGLDFNLTTSQYLQAYDSYIENAIAPIILSTKMFDSFIARLIGWQEKNFRRKVSFQDRRNFPGLAINFLLQPTPEKRLDAYRKLDLDRGIRLEFIKLFAERLDLYLKACNCELTHPGKRTVDLQLCHRIKAKIELELRSTAPLLVVYNDAMYWFQQATAFKQLILEKYVRMCLNEARKDYVQIFDCNVDLDDVIQVYLLSASRAIDKCDAKQGALTSHIKNWLLTGRTRVQESLDKHRVSVSYEHIDFDSDEFRASTLVDAFASKENETDRESAFHTIRYIAKLADPTGVARAYLRIQETLSEGEIATLHQLGEPLNEQSDESNSPLDNSAE